MQDLNDDCKDSDYTFIFNLLKWRGGILLETIFPGILLKYYNEIKHFKHIMIRCAMA